mmetsp:Transcript_4748/g.8241  ORF Transcript_4748/g.8241 Transcript_4748/m.8241 type:complete len:254 (-) Transcript_4748:477-1238(-)
MIHTPFKMLRCWCRGRIDCSRFCSTPSVHTHVHQFELLLGEIQKPAFGPVVNETLGVPNRARATFLACRPARALPRVAAFHEATVFGAFARLRPHLAVLIQILAHAWVRHNTLFTGQGLVVLCLSKGFAVNPLDCIPLHTLHHRAACVHGCHVLADVVGHEVVEEQCISPLGLVGHVPLGTITERALRWLPHLWVQPAVAVWERCLSAFFGCDQVDEHRAHALQPIQVRTVLVRGAIPQNLHVLLVAGWQARP